MKFAAKLLTALLSVLLLTAACLPVLEQTAHAAAAYYIQVDLTNQIVTVYQNGNVTNEGIVRQMICSSGTAATASRR